MQVASDILERIKIVEEDELRERIEAHPLFRELPPLDDGPEARSQSYGFELRDVLRKGTELTRPAYSRLFELLEASSNVLGLRVEARLFKVNEAGTENAMITTDGQRVLIQLVAGILSTVDEPAVLKTILAHELGHMGFGHLGRDTIAHVLAFDDECARLQSQTGRRSKDVKADLDVWQSDEFLSLLHMVHVLSQIQELNADRAQLLAVPDLGASIKASMLLAAGAADRYGTYDPESYLAQGREALEIDPPFDETDLGQTHPAEPMRAIALQFFSMTDVFADLTGSGPATHRAENFGPLLRRLVPLEHVLPRSKGKRSARVGTSGAPSKAREAEAPVPEARAPHSVPETEPESGDEPDRHCDDLVLSDAAGGVLDDRQRAELTYMLANYVVASDGRETASEKKFLSELVRPRRLAIEVLEAISELGDDALRSRFEELLSLARALPTRTKTSFLKIMVQAARQDRRVDDEELRAILDAAIAMDAESAGRRLLRNAFGSRVDVLD